MKKLLLAALVLVSFAEGVAPAAAAPSTTTTAGRDPHQMKRTRRRLHRQAIQRMHRNKRMHS